MKEFGIFLVTFILMSLVANIVPRFPHFPGDIYFDKIGIYIKIPLFSSLIISILLVLVFKALI